jgi:hypothetical protein
MKRRCLLFVLLACVCALVAAKPAYATTYVINQGNYTRYLKNGVLTLDGDWWVNYSITYTGGAPLKVVSASNVYIQGLTLDGTSKGLPGIDVEGARNLVLSVENCTVVGAAGEPAVRVPTGSSTDLKCTGSTFTGGSGAPAVGCAPTDSGMGTVILYSSGTVTLNAQGAPAIGHAAQVAAEATGTLQVWNGTLVCNTSGWDYDIEVARLIVNGGAFSYSGASVSGASPATGTLFCAYNSSIKGINTKTAVVPVKLAGLPASQALAGATLAVGGQNVSFTLGTSATNNVYDATGARAVNGVAWVYLPASELAAGKTLELTVGGATYRGTLDATGDVTGSASPIGGYYVASLGEAHDTPHNPTIDLGIFDSNQHTLALKEDATGTQYSTDGGATWQLYTGTLTLKGANGTYSSSYNYGGLGVAVQSGTINLILQNMALNSCNDNGAFTIAGGANVTMTLVGNSSIVQYTHSRRNIFIEKGSTLTIQGKGKLTAAAQISAAAIGGARGDACGKLYIKSGTVEASIWDGSATAIGAAYEGSMELVSISGGRVSAAGGRYMGSGIGASTNATLEELAISGGTVVATAYVGDHYTAGYSLGPSGVGAKVSAVKISGGTITAAQGVSGTTVTITGGSVNGTAYASNGKAITKAAARVALSDAAAAPDEDDGDPTSIYTEAPVNEYGQELAAVTITGLPANTAVDGKLVFVDVNFADVSDNPDKLTTTVPYSLHDVATNDEGELTFWLPKSEIKNRMVVAAIDGVSYRGTVVAGDDGALVAAMEVTNAKLIYQGFTQAEVDTDSDDLCAWAEDGAATVNHSGEPLVGIRVISPVEGVHVYYTVRGALGYGDEFVDGDTLMVGDEFYGMRMELTGENASKYQARYKLQTEDGWTSWAYDATELNVDKPVLAFAAELVEKTADAAGDAGDAGDTTPAVTEETPAASASVQKVTASGTPQTSDAGNFAALLGLMSAGVGCIAVGCALSGSYRRRKLQ